MLHKYTTEVLYVFCAFLALLILIFDLSMPLGVAGAVPYAAVVIFALWLPQKKAALYLAIICSALTVVGFIFSPEGGEFWKVITNRILALFVIWVTGFLVIQRKISDEKNSRLKQEIEKEKEKIYLATIHGAQHILNNLLNQLDLVYLEAKSHKDFDAKTLGYFDTMIKEATALMKELSAIKQIDDEKIRQSVHPK